MFLSPCIIINSYSFSIVDIFMTYLIDTLSDLSVLGNLSGSLSRSMTLYSQR